MKHLSKKSLIAYILMLIFGLAGIVLLRAQSMGSVFEWLGAIVGSVWLVVAGYGLYTHTSYRQLPTRFKVFFIVGCAALVMLMALLALIFIALKNFS
jgi:hypothetical protein